MEDIPSLAQPTYIYLLIYLTYLLIYLFVKLT
jgi:hypothetical protein